MQTRNRARQASASFDPGLAFWLPQDAQARIIMHALRGYATPVLRAGVAVNPARDIVALMRVCKAWAAAVSASPFTAQRQCISAVLGTCWLTDVAHLTGAGGGGSRQAKLNRIPDRLRLMLPPPDSTSERGGAIAHWAFAAQGAAAAVRWRTARVVRKRSEFETSSFPVRVPLLALCAAELRPPDLAWLLSVLASTDAAFLCPAVLRLTFPPATAATAAALDTHAGSGGSPSSSSSSGGRSSSSSPSRGGGSSAGRPMSGVAAGAGALSANAPSQQQQLTRAGVEAMASQAVAVGSDGPHMYMVPTGTTLRQTWRAPGSG
ncbi:hypothetical protein TSOC_008036 [Tetrabaena socialis]|uniref:Uncharacterized protein n=1 Tax=Tetrabaena socialis TaxID=47790 RepID=A0A2J7ZZI3_9CHLO|nr:hypothetical protein TSOC_008036 [Tetrabaena socialis]|eukprot:PNH05681.1 hypothetical protein TSOC_008036 [Tetrabaena socialis]